MRTLLSWASRESWQSERNSPYRAGRQSTWRKIKNPDFYRKEALGFGNQTKR
jgi:hypothetical protein